MRQILAAAALAGIVAGCATQSPPGQPAAPSPIDALRSAIADSERYCSQDVTDDERAALRASIGTLAGILQLFTATAPIGTAMQISLQSDVYCARYRAGELGVQQAAQTMEAAP